MKKIHKNRWVTAVFFIPFGIFALYYAAVLPFVMESPLLGFVLMGNPLAGCGFVMLMQRFQNEQQ
jgi:FtsH-binding integral membrane protein